MGGQSLGLAQQVVQGQVDAGQGIDVEAGGVAALAHGGVHAVPMLVKSEDKFRTLVETTSDWIWEVDIQGRYTYVSPKVKELLGYDPEEVFGKSPFDLMAPAEARRIAPIFEQFA